MPCISAANKPKILFDIIGVLLQGILGVCAKETPVEVAHAANPVEDRRDSFLYLFAHIPNFRLRCIVNHMLVQGY